MKNFFICVKKSKLIAIFLCFAIIFSHFLLYFSNFNYKNIVDNVSNKIFNGFNHKSQEYEINKNDGDIYFVSSGAEYIILSNDLPKLYLPLESEFDLLNGEICFKFSSGCIIKSSGEGFVKKVGYCENGLKFVEIKHSGGIITRYENLKTVGVGLNFKVKINDVLGLSCENENLVFKIMKDEKILNNFTIENGEIKWQN